MTDLHHENSTFLDGRLVRSTGEGFSSVDDSSTGEIIATVRHSSLADVEAAVDGATRAQRAWSEVPLEERVAVLDRWADGVESEAEALAAVEVAEVGTPVAVARRFQIDMAVTAMRATARGALRAHEEESADWARVVKEPRGVAAAITPWNYPAFQAVLKAAPALVAGCAMVMKPAELAPLAVMRLIELSSEAGVPPGVLNLVSGPGTTVGQTLASHPSIDFVSFTGSFAGGRAVAEAAATHCRPVALELGGKSPSVVLEEEMLEAAVAFTWASALQNAGQTCAALTRLLVPRARVDDAADLLAALLGAVVLGSAHDAGTTLGPLVSAGQRDRVLGMLSAVGSDGNDFIGSSPLSAARPDIGWFVPPSVVRIGDTASEIATEEVFGPVLCLIPFDDDDDAVRLVNAPDSGLTSRVWAADDERFLRVARRIRSGSVLRNDRIADWSAPFGGVRGSGYGRERGEWGVREYLTEKAIHD